MTIVSAHCVPLLSVLVIPVKTHCCPGKIFRE
jgi:hypothetical protein